MQNSLLSGQPDSVLKERFKRLKGHHQTFRSGKGKIENEKKMMEAIRQGKNLPVVENIVIEVDKLAINLKVPDAAIKRLHGVRMSSWEGSKLEGSCQVEQSVTGVEEGGTLLARGNLSPVGAVPAGTQLGAVLKGELGVAVVQNKHRRPAMSS